MDQWANREARGAIYEAPVPGEDSGLNGNGSNGEREKFMDSSTL